MQTLTGGAARIHVGLLLVGACTSKILSFLENAKNKCVLLDLPQSLNIRQCLLLILKSFGYGDFFQNSDLLNPLLLHCKQIILRLSRSLKILSSMNAQNILKWTATLFGMNMLSFLYLMSILSFSLLISSKDFLDLDISFWFPNCCSMTP